MAKSLTTDAGTLYRPGAYARYTVKSSPGALAANGILMLVGEADGGQDWTEEDDIEDNAFGPDDLSSVIAKYQSGPLVDAFRGAISASNDSDIVGSFSRAILVKTNVGQKASAALTQLDGVGSYATVYDKNFGLRGNQTQISVVAANTEVVPTTGEFTYIPAVGTVDIALRVNGGASATVNVVANRTPTDFVSDVDAASGVSASGGVNRGIITGVSGTLAIAVVSGNTITLTRSTPWNTTPTVGDTLVIPSTAPALLRDPAGGTTDDNVGAYVVTNATSTVITATKLSDAGRGGASAGTITAPVATAAPVAIAATTDAVVYSPVTINLTAGAVLQGAGKALEIAELTSGGDLLSRTAYLLGTTTAVSWVSKSATPALLTSGTESSVTLNASRAGDGISEAWTAGGEIALKLGYTSGSATVTITSTLLTTSTGLSLTLADYANIQELADFIDAQSGYSASVGTAALGLLPVSALDRVSAMGMSSQFGTIEPARIKTDAYRLNEELAGSQLVQINDPAARADAGLPAVTAVTYLANGLKGGSTNSQITAAIAGLEDVSGNFLVPLFSRDASEDITDGDTDSTSTYTISNIHAAARAHVLAMSQYKRRKNRQAILSIQDDFTTQRNTAANMATFRANMAFQNVKDTDGSAIVTYQPWMASVKAASMQAAGFYRPITNKLIALSGVTHAAGDFRIKNDSDMENALKAGLMPIKVARTGGWAWESDQTTYGRDNNFVFNSLQVVYNADIVAMSAAEQMEDAFVGKSTADVSAQVALTYLDQIMGNFLRLKLLSPSDDAKKGYKNARIRIVGNAMLVSVEIKLSTGIDFITIDFLVSQVEQTA